MKRLTRLTILVVTILTVHQICLSKISVATGTQNLADLRVENVSVKRSNVLLALADIAANYNVPIGLEVSSDDDLLKERNIIVRMKKGTLKQVLDSVVGQNPLYTWDIVDDVINVFPKSDREPFLKALLETRIESLRIAERMDRFTFRESLTKTPEVRGTLTAFGIQSNNEIFSSSDIRPLGRGFSLDASNMTVKSILNRVIRDSETKFWIVNRDGEQKQYLLLNF